MKLTSSVLFTVTLATALGATTPAKAQSQRAACFATLANTRNGTLGLPLHAQVAPDGQNIFFLRSGPHDTALHLYRFDVRTHGLTELAAPDAKSDDNLSVEEKARRERARQSMTGITDFDLASDNRRLIASQGGKLLQIDTQTGKVTPIAGEWIAPRLSPDGTHLAAVHQDDLYNIDLKSGRATRLTTGGSELVTHGLAEFAAAEELQRPDGAWWSPDGSTVLFEEADSRKVERHFIANPENPETSPVEFRYPRAGTNNADVKLGLVSAQGGQSRWVQWDHVAFPYLGRVVWRRDGGLFLVVLNRDQTRENLLSVDLRSGKTRLILEDQDKDWLDLTPMERTGGLDLPYALPGGDFLWAAQRGLSWQLERHGVDGRLKQTLTKDGLPFLALMDVNGNNAVIASDAGRIDRKLYRLDLDSGKTTPLAIEAGHHMARFTKDQHDVFVDAFNSAEGRRRTLLRDTSGHIVAELPSVAEPLPWHIHTEFTHAGSRSLDAVLIRPDNFDPAHRYPVVLSVYAGPGFKQVNHTPASYAEEQCLANQGYIVASLDGRGTPGRDHDFERATKNNLIDAPLEDQIAGLQALGARYKELDLTNVGVFGWSFGGYFTAMATIRRPDFFKVGVAGAPPVDFADYDTAYTERYLNTPQNDPDGYRQSNVLTYAAQLKQPLLLMHGITDDNVYFENSMKLTQALLRAGKRYDLLLLPGTHMLSDPVLRAHVSQVRADYLGNVLHPQ
ncbi:S9 family peptidase [Kozakia baliensis]|uniref:S9 family peptidase n=1 Tax=Kozakia baliensis TaxID=153496 RepID=UPI00049678AC|nr:DPP IV N-terminal domain-containing protein [Kozakia baliensis]